MASGMHLTAVAAGLVALCALSFAPAAEAHGGHFHLCPDTPSGRNYVRFEVGNCTNFVSLNASSGLSMTGKVTMWVYAYKNCSDSISSALEFNSTLFSNGVPLASTNTTGYGYTGTCASAGRSVYYDNATLGADPANMLFWYPSLTTAAGAVCGNAANDMVVRGLNEGGQLEAAPLQSVVVATDATGPALCCDLNLYPKPTLAQITSQTAPCDVASPSPPASSSAPPPAVVPSNTKVTLPGGAAALRMPLSALLGAALLLALALLA